MGKKNLCKLSFSGLPVLGSGGIDVGLPNKKLDAVGIEPTTFHMRSENHTPRPSARDIDQLYFSIYCTTASVLRLLYFVNINE